MNYSNHAELSIPLVGTLPQEAQKDDDEVLVNSSWVDEEQASCSNNLMQFALYFLLFLQFGISFQIEGNAVNGLRWSLVNVSICLFIASSHQYCNAMQESGVKPDTAPLLSEVIIVASMGLVFFNQVIPAFMLLVCGMLVMALTVVVVTSYRLWFYVDREEPSLKEITSEDSIV